MFRLSIGNSIELRLVTLERADELARVVIANYDHLRPWLPWVSRNYSIESAENFIRRARNSFGSGDAIQTWIIEKERIIGGIGFNSIDPANRSVEIGYWLVKEATGRGIVSSACSVMMEHAFDRLGIHRIVIRCARENLKSRAIPERLGFTEEGIARDAEWLHDSFVDLIVYSKLKGQKTAAVTE